MSSEKHSRKQSSKNLNFKRPELILSILFATIVAVRYFTQLLGTPNIATALPEWDQAIHGLNAVHFARAFLHLDIGEFFMQLANSSYWPPLFPMIQAIPMMILEPSFYTGRVFVLFWSALGVIAMLMVGIASKRSYALFAALLSATLLAISVEYQTYSVRLMLEIPVIVMSILTLACYVDYLESDSDPKKWNRTCLFLTLTFFTKFNYGIMMGIPIVLMEAFKGKAVFNLVSAIFTYLKNDIKWKKPFNIFIAIYLAFLGLVQLSGGFNYTWGVYEIQLKSIWGNPIYFLVFLLVIRNLIFNRTELKKLFSAYWNIAQPLQGVFRFIGFPVLLWFCYPPFFHTFFVFIFNEKTRDTSFWSMDTLTYYPSVFATSHMPAVWLAVMIGIGMLGLFALWRTLSKGEKALLVIMTFQTIMVFTHPNYHSRYLLGIIPFYLIAASLFYGRILFQFVGSKIGTSILIVASTLIFYAYLPIAKEIRPFSVPDSWDMEQIEQTRLKSAYNPICTQIKDFQVSSIVGISSEISPGMLAWNCYNMYPDLKRSQIPKRVFKHHFHNVKNLEHIVATKRIENFVIVEYPELLTTSKDQDITPELLEALQKHPDYREYRFPEPQQYSENFSIRAFRLTPALKEKTEQNNSLNPEEKDSSLL